MANSHNLGAYSSFSSEINDEIKATFEQALEGFVGVGYELVAVSTQIVAGVNYVFFCNATPVYPGSTSYPAMLHIFKPLDGLPSLTHIERV